MRTTQKDREIVVSWIRAGELEKAENWFHKVKHLKVKPDSFVCASFLRAQTPEKAVQLYKEMVQNDFPDNSRIICALISVLWDNHRDIFFQLYEGTPKGQKRSSFYGALVQRYAKENLQKAEEWFKKMQEETKIDLFTCTSLVNGYRRSGQWEKCLEVYELMKQQGVQADMQFLQQLDAVLRTAKQPEKRLAIEKEVGFKIAPIIQRYSRMSLSKFGWKIP